MKDWPCHHKTAQTITHTTATACPHAFGCESGFKRFTGTAQRAIYLCSQCEEKKDIHATLICDACAADLEHTKKWHIQGLPAVKKRPIPFSFSSRELQVPALENKTLLATAPFHNHCKLIIFSDLGELLLLDCISAELETLSTIDSAAVIRDGGIQLVVSPDNRYCAVTSCVYRKGEREDSNSGVVVNLATGEIVKVLGCDYYHMALAPYPVTFFEYNSKMLLVYASEWNKLDVMDLDTGNILSSRNLEECPEDDSEESTFTEWNGALVVSPDHRRIATVGWVWHPIGVAFSFDAKKWIEENCWEPDVGTSKKSYAMWDYFWDSPVVWIDEKRLCIWGAQSECSDDPPDCAAIFDADTGDMLSFFTGPTIDFFEFDEYLFSGTRDPKGLSVWSVEDGSLLCEVNDLIPSQYLRHSREFVSLKGNGNFLFTKWNVE